IVCVPSPGKFHPRFPPKSALPVRTDHRSEKSLSVRLDTSRKTRPHFRPPPVENEPVHRPESAPPAKTELFSRTDSQIDLVAQRSMTVEKSCKPARSFARLPPLPICSCDIARPR